MKPIHFNGEFLTDKNVFQEMFLPKRHHSSSEMKKIYPLTKNGRINRYQFYDISSFPGIPFRQLDKFREASCINERIDSTENPVQKGEVGLHQGDGILEVIRIKPRKKKNEPLKKKQNTKSFDDECKNQNNTFSIKKKMVMKKFAEKIKILPKIQNISSLTPVTRILLSSLDSNLKSIKSQHYFVFQHDSAQSILACRSKSKIQVASLTKIMTFYVCIQIADQFSINISTHKIKIKSSFEGYCGTSAYLEEGQIYTVEELLYGLMLPSGNDAAMSLAEWGGSLLLEGQNQPKVRRFVMKMNEEAEKLSLNQTKYGNPHGLPHKSAFTTCEDVAKLCSVCLKIPIFLKVAGTMNYKVKIYNQNLKKRSLIQWQNTNKLLRRPGFIGIKTGITVTAGPCLASAYRFRNKTYIVILAKCNKSSRRFKETRKLLAHCLERLQFEDLKNEEKEDIKKLRKNNDHLDSDYSDEEREFNFNKYDSEEMRKRNRIVTSNQ